MFGGKRKAVDEVVQRLAILRGRYAAYRDSYSCGLMSRNWKRIVPEVIVDGAIVIDNENAPVLFFGGGVHQVRQVLATGSSRIKAAP